MEQEIEELEEPGVAWTSAIEALKKLSETKPTFSQSSFEQSQARTSRVKKGDSNESGTKD